LRRRLFVLTLVLGLLAASCGRGAATPTGGAGLPDDAAAVAAERGLTPDDIYAALKTYTPTGVYDPYLMGGQSGQMLAGRQRIGQRINGWAVEGQDEQSILDQGDTMSDEVFYTELSAGLGETLPDSIVSRTLVTRGRVKAVLFGFAPGQELSEHTASTPAIVHILEGEAQLRLGAETHAAGPGAWAYMPAGLAHAVVAQTAVKMLLLLLRGEE
jgi:quercetin dioxygenase-like cupin family protein